jgi:hypothetical protein
MRTPATIVLVGVGLVLLWLLTASPHSSSFSRARSA